MLAKKALRDIRRNLAQFISVFLMAFASVFIYAGINSECLGMQNGADDFYKATNLADAWVYSADGFDDATFGKLRNIDGVTEAERRVMLSATAELENNPEIELYFAESAAVSAPLTRSGADFNTAVDGVWLDERFALARGIKLGDEIAFRYVLPKPYDAVIDIKKSVKGLIYSPEYVYMATESMLADFYNKGFAYVSAAFLPDELKPGGAPLYTQTVLKTSFKNADPLEDSVSAALDGKHCVFITQKNHPSVNMFASEIGQHKSMGFIFPIAFLLVATLIMLTTMTRLVSNQRTQIGALKSLGFGGGKIALHYMCYGFFVTLAGSLLGLVLGPPLLSPLFYSSLSAAYTLPVWRPGYDFTFALVIALTTALCTLASFIAAKSVLVLKPSEAVRPKAPKIHKTAARGGKLWNRLGFNVQWNLRDISRNKVRSVMAVAGALGCTALLVCSFNMNAAMTDTREWQYGEIYRFESRINLKDDATPEQIQSIVERTDGEKLFEGAVEIKGKGGKSTAVITVTDSANTLIRFTDKNRKPVTLPPDGVSISQKTAKAVGVRVGDIISWHLVEGGPWYECTVAAVFRSPSVQGIAMSEDVYKGFGQKFRPGAIVTAEHYTAAEGEGVNAVLYSSDLTAGWDELTKTVTLLIAVLIFGAVVLAACVLYNLGVLAFTEMHRELATLKVLGFKSGKLLGLISVQNLILTAVGFILGIYPGLLIVTAMTSTMGESFDMRVVLHPGDLIFSAITIFVTAIAVNLPFWSGIKKLDMVSSLKAAE
ncbi:MAG: FtsX-like permease family protein [Clostridiales bacterium]|jgi:putative ABC transport system permease protein|nr:FtsX-like permease family protein [Clostridiales bacterium]